MNSEKVIYYIGIGENKGSGRTVVCAEGQGEDTMSFREVGNNCNIEEALDRCIANIKGVINNRPVEFHIKSKVQDIVEKVTNKYMMDASIVSEDSEFSRCNGAILKTICGDKSYEYTAFLTDNYYYGIGKKCRSGFEIL